MHFATLPWPKRRHISVIADPPGWFSSYAQSLADQLTAQGHPAQCFDAQKDVPPGDIAFYLSCTGITPQDLLDRNSWNIVVHASALPQGRGFSPLVWQILEGQNTIPLSMITMSNQVDAGDIIMQREVVFQGHELNDELRDCMGQAIIEMCFDMAISEAPPQLTPQCGDPSWYPRRTAQDSRLDPHRSLADQFNLLRVVDNERYPAFFDLHGQRYVLNIRREPLKDD